MHCPKCSSPDIRLHFYRPDRKIRKCKKCGHLFNTEADLRNIAVWAAQRATRPEKIEEIKAVWDSPNFKTNARRLVHLMRHCNKVEYGYTLREFAHAIFPEKMNADPKEDGGWGPYYAKKNIQQMFRRFREDAENHEILLLSRFQKVKGIGRWYYYNMIEDEEGFKEYRLRQAKILLGMEKISQKMEDILEMSEEERRSKAEKLSKEIKQKYARREDRKKKKVR